MFLEQIPDSVGEWQAKGLDCLKGQLERRLVTSTAKNVIMYLGDGMSIPTVTAARIYLGQQRGQSGEESVLSFEKFPWTGFAKVPLTSQLSNYFYFYIILA